MSISILHKYSPKNIDEFQLPDDLKTLLHKLISMSINMLFIGNGGTGKSTLLKLLVKEYYNNDTDNNIMYINNLSDNGINFYRSEVKTFCSIPCKLHNKKKMIVIDDMDVVVNDQCQQILRNFIDKYENNVMFLISCSNIQHIIDTIQSRFNIIRIPLINDDGIKAIYNNIKSTENIIIDDDTKQFIITLCNKSVSVLLNYMEKFKLYGDKITLTNVKDICSIVSYSDYDAFTDIVFKRPVTEHDMTTAKNIFIQMINNGYSVVDILDNYFNYIKHSEIVDEETKYRIIPIINRYIVYFNNYHEDDIELFFFIIDLYDLRKEQHSN